MTIHNKQWHNFAASEARALGDIMLESTGGIISECPGDFIGIRNLFSEAADLTDLRHFVLRPRGQKAAVDELQEAVRKLSDDYDTYVGRLVSEGLLAPLLCVIHIRYDHDLGVFDLHAHCIWRVAPEKLDAVFQGVQTKFSTVWMEKEPIRKPAALANYLVTWVLDHRDLQDWPRDAILALWNLKRPRFIRSAGAFAEFCAGLSGYRFVREGGAVLAVPLQRRPTPPIKGSAKELKTGSVVGFVQAKLMGQLRWCAIAVVKCGERLTRRHIDDILANSTRAARRAPNSSYPTTMTGLSPFSGNPSPNPAHPPPNEAQRPAASPANTNPAPAAISPSVTPPAAQGTLPPDRPRRASRWQMIENFLRVGVRGLLKALAWLTPRARRRMRKSRDPDTANDGASGPDGIAAVPPT